MNEIGVDMMVVFGMIARLTFDKIVDCWEIQYSLGCICRYSGVQSIRSSSRIRYPRLSSRIYVLMLNDDSINARIKLKIQMNVWIQMNEWMNEWVITLIVSDKLDLGKWSASCATAFGWNVSLSFYLLKLILVK